MMRRGSLIGALAALTLVVTGCAQPVKEPMPPAAPRIIAATQPLRGVVIFVAGLNNRPEVLDPIARALAEKGFEALIVSLHGHAHADWPAVDYLEHWRSDLDAAHRYATTTYRDTPQLAVGFSLGGTLLLDYVARTPDHHTVGLALIAPAITLTNRTAALRPLLALRGTGLTVPSFAPEETRAHSSTSLRAYRGMFTAADVVRRRGAPHKGPSTVVFAHRNDELVHFEDLHRWLRGSPTFRMIELRSTIPPPSGYYHQLFDRRNVGEAGWAELIETLVAEFSRLTAP